MRTRGIHLSETSVINYQSTQRRVPEASFLQLASYEIWHRSADAKGSLGMS